MPKQIEKQPPLKLKSENSVLHPRADSNESCLCSLLTPEIAASISDMEPV